MEYQKEISEKIKTFLSYFEKVENVTLEIREQINKTATSISSNTVNKSFLSEMAKNLKIQFSNLEKTVKSTKISKCDESLANYTSQIQSTLKDFEIKSNEFI